MAEAGENVRSPTVFPTRAAAALFQAAAFYLLVWASDAPYRWPATSPGLFVPLFVVAAFVPLILIEGIGRIPARPLAIWLAAATVIIAVLGYHDIARGVPAHPNQVVFWPSYQLWPALLVGIFIAHVLVTDAITERRWLTSYARHFDTVTKLTVQAALSGVFVAVLWGLLTLGAGLFKLVAINFFVAVIQHRWFAYPVTALGVAVAIQLTDVQPALIRGVRSLALTLFSWLLPLLVVILLGFLGILPFISLAPLWKTHFATSLLLAASGAVIFLINCCYQDGAAEQATSQIKRLAGTIGAIELLPLAGLAVWGLALRVGQYGWSTDRIYAAAAIGVACCFAIGYASAAIWSQDWLRRVEITNVATAWVVLALILALFTPIADPARLMVADQLARLKSNAVKVSEFDFAALKFDGARWGAAALAELSRSDAADVKTSATRALALTSRPWAGSKLPGTGSHVDVFPSGRVLPAVFLEPKIWGLPGGALPACIQSDHWQCSALFVALRPGEPEVLMFFGALGFGAVPVFEQDQSGQWRKLGGLDGPTGCERIRPALEHGDVVMAPHELPDLRIGGLTFAITPLPGICDPGAAPSR